MAPNFHGKRKVDAIDLTNSDDESPPSQRQRANGPPPTDGIAQSQRDNWTTERTDEERAEDILVLSQEDGEENTSQSFELYGTLNTKVVGIQYYTGHATVNFHEYLFHSGIADLETYLGRRVCHS